MAESEARNVLGRRQLLVLGASATAACSSGEPLGGPFGGTTTAVPPPGAATNTGLTDGGALGDAGGGVVDSGPACAGGTCSATGNVLTLTFTEYPALLQSGGSVSLKATGYQDPNCGQSGIIVVQKGKGQYVCFSSSCTHACCEVAFSGGEFKCPCHGTVFDLTGKPTGGPANGNLPSLAVCADSCGVHVTLA